MNNYNFTDYVSNSVIRSVADDLMANPQKTVEFSSTIFGGRTWTLTENNNSSTFGPEQTAKIFILKRIWNAVVFFFKSFNQTFCSNFNTAMQRMNDAYKANQLALIPDGAPALTLPKPIIEFKIVVHLTYRDCRAMAAVCTKWKEILENFKAKDLHGLSLLDEKLFSEVVDLKNKRLVNFVGKFQMDAESGLKLLTKKQLKEILVQYKNWFVEIKSNAGAAGTKYNTSNLKILQIHVRGNKITLSFEEKYEKNYIEKVNIFNH